MNKEYIIILRMKFIGLIWMLMLIGMVVLRVWSAVAGCNSQGIKCWIVEGAVGSIYKWQLVSEADLYIYRANDGDCTGGDSGVYDTKWRQL